MTPGEHACRNAREKDTSGLKTALVSLIVLGFLFVAPAPSEAAWNDEQENESRVLSDRWNLWVGSFSPEFKTEVAVGRNGGLGTLIRLEDILALKEDLTTFRVGGFYRFNNKRAIVFDYSALNRSAVTAISIDVDFEDFMFSAGAIVNSTFDNDIVTVTYRHSFVNNGKTESGFTAGLSVFAFDVVLEGIATFDDGSGPVTRQGKESASIFAPVPAVGMYINHAFTSKWILRMSAAFLNLDVGDIEGRYLTTSFTVDWIFTKHLGLGFGVQRSDLDFSDTGGDKPFTVQYRLGGPTLYASVVF